MKGPLLAGSLLLAALMGVYGYAATSRERTYGELIDSGEAAMVRGDGNAAIAAFSGAITLKGESMLGYLKRGEAYARRGEYDAALPDLYAATRLDPAAPRAQELLGDVNYALLRHDRAAQRYETYLRLDDGSPRILYKLALARYGGGQLAPAIAALRAALSIEETFAESHYLLALCLRDLQDARSAVAPLERAVALAPAMLQAREELAGVYGHLGRPRDRIKQLEALHALEPGPSREVALGLAYADAGRLEHAVMRLGEVAERYPDHAQTYVALGRVWLETAQRDGVPATRSVALTKALGALESAVGSEDSSEALTLYGRALLMASTNDELAERILRQATQKLPADPMSFFYLAEAAERRGHVDRARRALLDYHAITGEDPDRRRAAALAERIADLSTRLNDPATAVRWYTRAADAAPATAALLVRLAEAQLRSGDPAAARRTLTTVLEKAPGNRAARTLLRRLQ